MTGQAVRTVTGEIAPESLGPTSLHEHVLVDASTWYTTRTDRDARFRDLPVTVENLPSVRWHAYSFLDNLVLDDASVATSELKALALAGGAAIVDMTCSGLGGSPEALPKISTDSGVHIILGCGYYVHRSHAQSVCTASIGDLEESIQRQVQLGIDGTHVRPGVVGEIGMSAPPERCERRVLRAGARVAARHGMSLHIHTDGGGAFAPQHVADCAEEGLAPERVVCGHMDERLDPGYHRTILEAGANIAFDTFGSELAFSGLFHHPSDRERMKALVALVDAGFAGQIVLGHDVFVKAHLHRFGGYGYDHLLSRVIPALRDEYGVTEHIIERLLVNNPRRLLSCHPSETRYAGTNIEQLPVREESS